MRRSVECAINYFSTFRYNKLEEIGLMEKSRNSGFSGTLSILAISVDSKFMGIATASGSPYVGDRVPHAKPGVGVIVTQAYTNIIYGTQGIELLMRGLTPQEALNKLLEEDNKMNLRQIAMMDFKKRKAVFTGAGTPLHHAEIVGDDYIVIGNLLSSKEVARSTAKQFEDSSGDLAWRMVEALKMGSKCGGDRRGERSATLIVIGAEKIVTKIKVDAHNNPLEELLRNLQQ